MVLIIREIPFYVAYIPFVILLKKSKEMESKIKIKFT